VQALRNVLSNWGAFVVSAAVGFFLSPFIVHNLGNSAYGAWVLLSSVTGYMGLLDLGVRSAVTKYVATLQARSDAMEASRIVSAALVFFSLAGLLAVGTAALFAEIGLHHFNIAPDLIHSARVALVVTGFNVAVALVGGVFGGVIVGLQRFDRLNAVSITSTLIRTGLIIAAIRSGGALVSLALIHLIMAFFESVANLVLARRLYPELKYLRRDWGRHHLQKIFSFGFFASLLHVAGMFFMYSDSFIIGAFLPVGFVAYYAVGANLIHYGRMIVSGISQTVTPMVGALEGQADDIGTILLKASGVATLIVTPIALTLIQRGATFIDLWMGPEYGELSGRVAMILSVGLWVFASFQICTTTMLGLNKHRGMVPAFFIEAGVSILLSILLISRYGIVGVAIGSLAPRLANCLLFGPWYARKMLNVPISKYWLSSWIRPGLAMLPFAFVTHWIEKRWPAPNLAMFFLQIGCAVPIAALGAYYLGFSPSERRSYRSLLTGLRRRQA
jgi:O-antigen/teichoic acid export membrane protein